MEKLTTKSAAREAKKEQVQKIQTDLILALKLFAGNLGYNSKKLDKEIGKSSKHLAKVMLKKSTEIKAETAATTVAKATPKPVKKAVTKHEPVK